MDQAQTPKQPDPQPTNWSEALQFHGNQTAMPAPMPPVINGDVPNNVHPPPASFPAPQWLHNEMINSSFAQMDGNVLPHDPSHLMTPVSQPKIRPQAMMHPRALQDQSYSPSNNQNIAPAAYPPLMPTYAPDQRTQMPFQRQPDTGFALRLPPPGLCTPQPVNIPTNLQFPHSAGFDSRSDSPIGSQLPSVGCRSQTPQEAATKIQAVWRAFRERKEILQLYRDQIKLLAKRNADLQLANSSLSRVASSPEIRRRRAGLYERENAPSPRSNTSAEHLEWKFKLLKGELEKTRQRYAEVLAQVTVKDTDYAILQDKISDASATIAGLQQDLNYKEKELGTCRYLLAQATQAPTVSTEVTDAGEGAGVNRKRSVESLASCSSHTTLSSPCPPSANSESIILLQRLEDMFHELQVTRATLRDRETELERLRIQKPGCTSMNDPGLFHQSVQSAVEVPRLPYTAETVPGGTPRMEDACNGPVEASDSLNYRQLLAEQRDLDWPSFVDKIVITTDQQASIFLQQKLKIGSTEQQRNIVNSVIARAVPLMTNRFGNFLVQRCFEYANEAHQRQLGESMVGSIVELSKDPFGCHVVQKCFDTAPEDLRYRLVEEMSASVHQSLTDRYACHVWQKIFELRWTQGPPACTAMNVVSSLRGQWADVCLDETGSLVVQNIFENFEQQDKQEIIEEVLAAFPRLMTGQWSNWVIQHLLEHGSTADKQRIVEKLLDNVVDYSMDGFSSKVMERAIKLCSPSMLDGYLQRICDASSGPASASYGGSAAPNGVRRRNALIDIASDQHGSHLVQFILTHASTPEQRDVVIEQVHKHMVSLRGSRYGSKVAYLVERWRAFRGF